LAMLGFEIRVSCLLGRLSITEPQPHSFCFRYFSGRVLCFLPVAGPTSQPCFITSTLCLLIGITVLVTLCPGH
jgi:hypothetical protein